MQRAGRKTDDYNRSNAATNPKSNLYSKVSVNVVQKHYVDEQHCHNKRPGKNGENIEGNQVI